MSTDEATTEPNADQADGENNPRAHDPAISESLYGDSEGHWARLTTRTGYDWIIPPTLEITVGQVGAKRQAELVYLGETSDALTTLYQRLQQQKVAADLQAFIGQRLGLSQTAVSALVRQKNRIPNLRAEAWSVLVHDLIDSRGW